MVKRLLMIVCVVCWQGMCAWALELRVMTYNIHHALGDDGKLDLNRIASVISAANPDLVSMQEVDHDVSRSNNVLQTERLAELTGMQWYWGKTRSLDGGGVGNGVLVRNGITIHDTINHLLPNPDDVEPRRVIEMDLSFDTTEFKFFATHLMHNSSAGRIESAQYINGLISGSTVPAILAGDMNFNPGSTAFNTIDNQWIDLTNVNNSGKNRENQIDYVFYRSSNQWDEVSKSQFIVNATTNVASDHHPILGVLSIDAWPENALVWNVNSGVATGVSDGFATGDGSQAVGVFPASPWSSTYNTGTQNLIMGYNANGTFSGTSARTIGSLRIGTNQANAIIASHNGNGVLTASGSVGLVVSSTSASTGDAMIGEGGFAGTLTWSSSGTLEVQGKLRVGQTGTGTFNQNNGVVIGGNTAGSLKFLAVGHTTGSQGVYNLNNGVLRPSGGFAGTEFRQTVVGDAGATGEINVGDGSGAANSAAIESNDDLIVGRAGGTGLMRVRSDGKVELRTSSNAAELLVGQDSTGTVIQTGGLVKADALVRIGSNPGSVGHYTISGGSLNTASDGSGTFQIGRNGATGTLRVESTGIVTHGAELFIGTDQHTSTSGRLELIGSTASVQFGQLDNFPDGANGVRETMFWQADASGITPLTITGEGPLASNFVQLQDTTEVTASTGSGFNRTGDGIALALNLAALTESTTLMLINNDTEEFVTGLFENGTTKALYGEGEVLSGTGYIGTVTISYLGGTGNDVTLNLASGLGDHDGNGVVDALDYVVWRKTDGGNPQGYLDWQTHYNSPVVGGTGAAQVPEPVAWLMIALATTIVPRIRR